MTVAERMRGQDAPLAEEGLIGALLLRPSVIAEVAGQVQPEDILAPRMANIYRAMLAVVARGIDPTLETIADECQAVGTLENIGGRPQFTTLQAHADSTYPAKYVPAILEASLRRRVITRCRQAQETAADPLVSASDALDAARELFATIDVPTDVPSEVVDVATFCAGEDSYDWLVPSLLERGDRLLVVAAEGGGKSVLLRQMAVCCAIGVHPFSVGARPIDPVRVLLIDLENPTSLVRRKVRPIFTKGRQVRPQLDPSMLGIVSRPGGIDVLQRTDARWLQAQITAAKPDLVVAGPLYKMFSADEKKWEAGAARVTGILDDLRTRLGFALILETHAPHGFGAHRAMRPVGSSIWLRWPDFGLSFAPVDRHAGTVKVTMWKDRDERYWPKFLQRGGSWPWTPCRDPDGPGAALPPVDESPPDPEQGEF